MADGDDDIYLDHPNRRKAASKATRAVVVLLLLVTILLSLVIAVGGWDTMLGARWVQLVYTAVFAICVVQVIRWSRGVLPIIAALAMILGIFAAISGPGWFDRDKSGFEPSTLDAGLLGLLTLILVPVQLLLIAFAMRGFAQAWNVEEEVRPGQERRVDEGRRGGRQRPGARLAGA